MRYDLEFKDKAQKEWNALAVTIREQFAKKLMKVLENPRIPSAALHGMADCYKIKLRKAGYRLVYQVTDRTIIVTVTAVGRRDGDVYDDALKRQC